MTDSYEEYVYPAVHNPFDLPVQTMVRIVRYKSDVLYYFFFSNERGFMMRVKDVACNGTPYENSKEGLLDMWLDNYEWYLTGEESE